MDGNGSNRKSYIDRGDLYFWTATINGWKHLLKADAMKMEIIQSLQWLKQRELINVYAYVIMPSHLHFVWKINGSNGKESPQGSLLKYTAHRFKQILAGSDSEVLKEYSILSKEKAYEFWQRDPLAIRLFSRPVIIQKMNYIHNNPVAKNWRLAVSPEAYRFSSASFYENGIDEFCILSHIGDVM